MYLQYPGGGIGSGGAERTAVLSGAIDGINRIFAFPIPVIYDPPSGIQVRIHHGGRRLAPDQFTVYESDPGISGLDTVRLLYFAPYRSDIYAEFLAA